MTDVHDYNKCEYFDHYWESQRLSNKLLPKKYAKPQRILLLLK